MCVCAHWQLIILPLSVARAKKVRWNENIKQIQSRPRPRHVQLSPITTQCRGDGAKLTHWHTCATHRTLNSSSIAVPCGIWCFNTRFMCLCACEVSFSHLNNSRYKQTSCPGYEWKQRHSLFFFSIEEFNKKSPTRRMYSTQSEDSQVEHKAFK